MIQVSIAVDNSQKEIEKQINNFFKINKDNVKYVDIKYVIRDSGYTYAMIIYDTIEEDSNTLKL
jgi:hypothetical protein